jgi:Immunity protein Imm1
MMFISTVSWDEWDRNYNRGDVISVTTWDEVRSKIESLDGRSRTLVTLEGDGEVHMSIGGGAGRYVVYVTFDNEEFEYLVDRSRDGSEVESIVVGGQMGDYAGRLCVGLPIVLRAARLFGETGEVERSLWERDDVLEFA